MRLETLTEVEQRYRARGHALLERLIDPETAARLVAQFVMASPGQGRGVGKAGDAGTAVRGAAIQVYGNRSPPLAAFHWGLTPIVSAAVGIELIPSYCMFRVYSRGATLLVHRDRPGSEHGLSLTLARSDDMAWPFEIGTEGGAVVREPLGAWGDISHWSYSMQAGDALLYRATEHLHARTVPNPNDSSVHAFLFWVDPAGAHAAWRHDNPVAAARRRREEPEA